MENNTVKEKLIKTASLEINAVCSEHDLPMLAYTLAEGTHLCQVCATQYFTNVKYCYKHMLPKTCAIENTNFKVCKACLPEDDESEPDDSEDLNDAESLYDEAIQNNDVKDMLSEWQIKLRRELMKTRHMFAQSVEEVSQEIHRIYSNMLKQKSIKFINSQISNFTEESTGLKNKNIFNMTKT